MQIEDEYIRLIFGLKLKQIRTDKNLSLFGLAKLSGLSKSYLNEIEKGKKYPKTDKIILLSEKLEVPYDHFVSLKLDKNLAPIGEILQSKILKEIPLDLFGIKENNLIDIIANAPAKVNAFISTIIKIAQNYNLTRESFFLASLRSYQEAHNNYFEETEAAVEKFAKEYHIDLTKIIRSQDLEEILIEEFNYTINTKEFSNHKNLEEIRTIFVPNKKILLLKEDINEAQKTFIYAKELAYNYLKIDDRLYTFPWIQFKSFDQVLNNFIASYFAGALIIPKDSLIEKLKNVFKKELWQEDDFVEILNSYNCSAETFYQRLTNILPKHFHIKNLFFLRFNKIKKTPVFKLKKELHITQQQDPHGNRNNEHYCRRWIALQTLADMEKSKKRKAAFSLQISSYDNSNSEYLVLSSASPDPFKVDQNRSTSIGMLLSPHLKKKIQFSEDPKIPKKIVGVTCETCAVKNCKERVVPPVLLNKQIQYKEISETVKGILSKFS